MKKLRFKNRNGILYFGLGDKFKSSKLPYSNINKNIIIGKFKSGRLDEELGLGRTNNLPYVTELLEEVMASKSKVLKYKTVVTYSMTCKNWIIPYFQDKLVTQIKPIDIKRFQDSLVTQGLQKQSINLARILLREVFDLAIINEHCTLNPIVMVRTPKLKEDKKKQIPCSLDEIDSVLEYSKGTVRNFLGISFFTGMRSGELLALKWSDIDFETDTISITKTISGGFINSPKTKASERDIEMLSQAKEFFKAQQLETGLKSSFVFLNSKNTHYGTNNYFYTQFKSILSDLKLETRSLHNTRHTFASIMLNNRIDPLWVSNTLGHGNLNMTLEIYTHYMPKKEKMSIDFLEKRYKNGTNGL